MATLRGAGLLLAAAALLAVGCHPNAVQETPAAPGVRHDAGAPLPDADMREPVRPRASSPEAATKSAPDPAGRGPGPAKTMPSAAAPRPLEGEKPSPDSPGEAKALKLIAAGEELLAQGKAQEAAESFSSAIDLDRTNLSAWLGRGRARRAMARGRDGSLDEEQVRQAIADFDRAVRLDPQSVSAHYGRAQCHLLRGMSRQGHEGQDAAAKQAFDRALADCATAIRLSPGLAGPRLDRALIYEAMGRPGKALEEYRAAEGTSPGNLEAHKGIERCEAAIAGGKPTGRAEPDAQTP